MNEPQTPTPASIEELTTDFLAGDVSTERYRSTLAGIAAQAAPHEYHRARVPMLADFEAVSGAGVLYFVQQGGTTKPPVTIAEGVTATFYEDGRLFCIETRDAKVFGADFVARVTAPANAAG